MIGTAVVPTDAGGALGKPLLVLSANDAVKVQGGGE